MNMHLVRFTHSAGPIVPFQSLITSIYCLARLELEASIHNKHYQTHSILITAFQTLQHNLNDVCRCQRENSNLTLSRLRC